jgi:hypothetical protein
VPRVPAAERERFEAAASRDAARRSAFLEPTESGALDRAPRAREYFPTLYVEPLLTADTELGLDHLDGPDPPRGDVARARHRPGDGHAAGAAARRSPDARGHRDGAGLPRDRRAAGSGRPSRLRQDSLRGLRDVRSCRSTTWRRTWRAKPPRCAWPPRSWT